MSAPGGYSASASATTMAPQSQPLTSATAVRRSELDDEIQEMDLGAELDVRNAEFCGYSGWNRGFLLF